MKIAIAASECAPFAKTGGLADVIGALPKALAEIGCEVKVFLPRYSIIDENRHSLHYESQIGEIPIRVAGVVRSVHILRSTLPQSDVDVFFVDCPHYFYRRYIYTMDPDEDERYILFCKAVIETMQYMKWVPDVIQCNDWQTGLIPVFIKENYNWDRMFDKTATVMSIHNIAYQGRFPESTLDKAELRRKEYYPGGPYEFYNTFSFLKTGIIYSEVINTVSETYAREILTPQFGEGMEKVLWPRQNDLHGVINGIDYHIWDPETDPHIPFHYNEDKLDQKIKNKELLLKNTTIPFKPNVPLIGIVSRLVTQKGFDLIADVLSDLVLLDVQWVLLGSGEDRFENLFRTIGQAIPHKFWSYIGFSNELAHLIEAGADMFLMPSHYEPCGLNQMYSLRYGTVPIVRKTGGLADTVLDWHEFNDQFIGNGFSFNESSGYALFTTVKRALDTFKDKETWRKIQINGMKKDFSWTSSAKKYRLLYEEAYAKRNKNK
ncbi:glycogen synthase GlgA [bacterium]|nr:glycogen synthase GlgA [bacterium]